MNTKISFRTFLEEFRDIFGFDEELKRKQEEERTRIVDEKPIQPFNSNQMLEHLARKKLGTQPRGFQKFTNTVQWGQGPGAIRCRVGSQYTVYLERLVIDLDNNPVWTTKKVFRINTDNYKKYVESVGDAIHDELQRVSNTGLDAPRKQFDHVLDLAEDIAKTVNNYANEFLVFDSIKKVTDNNSILVYWVKGAGVGALQNDRGQGRIDEYIVDVSFNEATGMIRIMNTAVQSGNEGISWHIMPSSFEGMFCPSQKTQEIAEAVTTALKWFS